MKYIRYTFWGIVAICLIFIGISNTQEATLSAVPDGLAGYVPFATSVTLPLFMVIFFGVAIGLLIGFLWEWVREHRVRTEARAKHREVSHLKREVERLKDEKNEGQDEILALLDKAS